MLGRARMLEAEMVLPEDRYFPDRYDGTRDSVVAMAERVAAWMGVARDAFTVEIFAENEDLWRDQLPARKEGTKDAAGFYFHEKEDGRYLVGVHAKTLSDPLELVATLAHEFAHVILLGGGLLARDTPDMEPMTDLATVFLGLGFFGASAAFQFKQFTGTRTQGWSTKGLGYLPEELWGYCLGAVCAGAWRGETTMGERSAGRMCAARLSSRRGGWRNMAAR